MRKLVFYLAVALIIFYTPTSIAQSPTPPTPEEYLVNPDVYVEDLPSHLISGAGLTFETPLGLLRTNFLDNLQRLFLQYNEDDWQYFDVPPDWEFGADGTIEVFVFPNGEQVLYCNHAVRAEAPYRTTGVGIIIEPLTGNVRRVETCYITPNANGYVYSEELASPDGTNMVLIGPIKDGEDEETCPPLEHIRQFGYPSRIYLNGERFTCINAPGIEGRGWVGENKLTLRVFDPKDSLPVEYWYQLDVEAEALTPLGMTIELQHSLFFNAGQSTFLLADGKTLVRWMIDTITETERHPTGVFPETCKVEMLNLETLDATSFGQSPLASCLYYPEMVLSEAQDRLLYVHTVPNEDPENLDASTSTLMLIDLTTQEERALSISGRIVHIISLSPDSKRALIVVDQNERARYNPYENGLAYVAPHWIVYDLEADAPLYISQNFHSLYGHISEGKFGFKGFKWTETGWQTIVDAKSPMNELSLLISEDSTADTLTEIPLEALTTDHEFGDLYYADVSPDGNYYRVSSKSNRPTYLVETATGRVVEWTIARDVAVPEGIYDSQRWRDDGSIEISFYSTTNLLTLGRWQVDPAKAFEE